MAAGISRVAVQDGIVYSVEYLGIRRPRTELTLSEKSEYR